MPASTPPQPTSEELYAERPKPPILRPGYSYATVGDKIAAVVLERTPLGWWIGFAITFGLVMLLLYAITRLLVIGIGIWGVNVPVAWGMAISNFVWWIGIGHAGTLISAILL